MSQMRLALSLLLALATPAMAQWPENNGKGLLPVPGAVSPDGKTRGYLQTPGQNSETGFLDIGGIQDPNANTGYLVTPGTPNPNGQVTPTRPVKGPLLGPWSTPLWQQDAYGNPLQAYTDSMAQYAQVPLDSSDRSMPNPQGEVPRPYQPSSVYDRGWNERAGGDVTFHTHQNEMPIEGKLSDRAYHGWLSELPNAESWFWGPPVVVDGDTLLLAGNQVRLSGIDAPELDQLCSTGNITQPCGYQARDWLASQIEHTTVACLPQGQDSVGRVFATCQTADFDINGGMIASGWAVPWKMGDTPYGPISEQVAQTGKGIWGMSFSHPQDWREANAVVDQFPVTQNGRVAPGQRDSFPFIPFGQSPKGKPQTEVNTQPWNLYQQ